MPHPRVRCDGCAFEWFSRTSAHGLRIVGTCPRCGGTLDFLVPVEEEDHVPYTATDPTLGPRDDQAPATVLGQPLRR